MQGNKGYILVEGHGEVTAVQNLINRLSHDIGFYLPWSTPRRLPNIHQWEARATGGVKAAAELIRMKVDAGALLIIKDADTECPKHLAPNISSKLRSLSLPFPVAYVLLRPEYEVLFLPCLDQMGYPPWDLKSWEDRRGIKEWLSSKLPRGRAYKPTVDQLPMTRKIDLAVLREANIPCFGSLERAIHFLSEHLGHVGESYP